MLRLRRLVRVERVVRSILRACCIHLTPSRGIAVGTGDVSISRGCFRQVAKIDVGVDARQRELTRGDAIGRTKVV